MAKENRNGNRKPRSTKQKMREPELGYYLIVTDTEGTERCYFDGLYNSIPEEMRDRLVIRTYKTKTQSMIKKCKELKEFKGMESHHRIPWLIFDKDEIPDKVFDDRIAFAQKEGIHVGWSNPCFEIWMYAYFGSMPTMQDSQECCNRFATEYKRRTGIDYSKTEEHLYEKLCRYGNEKEAFAIAKQKMEQCKFENNPSKKSPATAVYELVEAIRKKVPYNNMSKM